MGFPGKAEHWFNRTVQHEPLLFDEYLYIRIVDSKADSLLAAKKYIEVIELLEVFLIRFERTGIDRQSEISNCYLRLGTSYHALDEIDNAIAVWRQGIRPGVSYYYPDHFMSLMAESLFIVDKSFTQDSLTLYVTGDEGPYTPDVFYDVIRVIYAVIFSIALWFGIGLGVMVVIIASHHQQKAEQRTRKREVAPGRIAIRFLLLVLVPCTVVPLLLAAFGLQIYILHYLYVVISGSGGVIGIVISIVDGRRIAKKENTSMIEALRQVFVPLWLSVAVLLALGVSILIGLASVAFLFP